MATTAKVIIKAEDQISQGLKSAEKNLTNFEKTTKKVGDTLKSAFTIGAITTLVGALVNGAKACVESFNEAEQVIAKLERTLNNAGSSINITSSRLQQLAKSFQSVTTYSDEAVLGVTQILISTQKVGEEILPRATEAVLDLASALGIDASSAAETLAQALAQPTEEFEALKEYQIYLTDAQRENIETLVEQNKLYEAQSVVLESIEDSYGGIANALANTNTGKVEQLKNAWNDLKTGIGEVLMNSIESLVDFSIDMVEKVNDAIETQLSWKDIEENTDKAISTGQGSWSNMSNKELQSILNSSAWYKWYQAISQMPDFTAELQREIEAISPDWSAEDMKAGKAALNELEIRKAVEDYMYQWRKDYVFTPEANKEEFARTGYKESATNTWNSYGDAQTAEIWRRIRDEIAEYLPKPEVTSSGGSKIEGTEIAAAELQASSLDALEQVLGPLAPKLDIIEINFDKLMNSMKSIAESELMSTDLSVFNDSFNDISTRFSPIIKYLEGLQNNQSLSEEQRKLVENTLANVIGNLTDFKADFDKYLSSLLEKQDKLINAYETEKSERLKSDDDLRKDIAAAILESANADEFNKIINEYNKNLGNVIDFANADLGTDLFNPMFDGIDELIAEINESVEKNDGYMSENVASQKSYLEKLRKGVEESFKKALEEQAKALEGVVAQTSGIIDYMKKGPSGILEEKVGSLLDDLSRQGGFVGIIATILSEILGEILDGIQPILDAIDSVANPLSLLGTLLAGFSDVLAPALGAVFAPFIDTFRLIGNYLGQIFLPILDALAPSFNALGMILSTAIMPILQILTPVLNTVAILFEIISPIIQTVAALLVLLAAPVQWVADLFSWLGEWITYIGDVIGQTVKNIGYMITFQWGRISWDFGENPGGFSSDAFSGIDEKLDKIYNVGNTEASDAATGTSISSASYQGATQVTINIYQNSPVVGTGGMEEFAQMIRQEFLALDYYGV